MNNLTNREKEIYEAILSARHIQEWLWGDIRKDCTIEIWYWLNLLKKKIIKLEEIDQNNPHYKIELRKRLLQTAGIAIAWIENIKNNDII